MTATSNPLMPFHFGKGAAASGPSWTMPGPVFISWTLLSAALLAFIVRTTIQPIPDALDHVLFMISAVTCGLAWLFARALFRRSDEVGEVWPYAFVASLFGLAMLSKYVGLTQLLGLNLLGTALALSSSAILVLTVLEPLAGLRGDVERSERRFRWLFFSGYALILFFGVILVRASDASSALSSGLLAQQDRIYVACAVAALIGATLAAWYRYARTFGSSGGYIAANERQATDAEELARRLWDLLKQERLYLDPDLRVDTVSRLLAVPSYRISRAVTSHLGFQNFNRMVNALRLNAARAKFVDPDYAQASIMTIAFDCGFASIGPFNRAFKERFGVTPRAYRKENCEAHADAKAE